MYLVIQCIIRYSITTYHKGAIMAAKRGRKFLRGTTWWIQYWFNGKDRRESTRSTNEAVADKLLTKRLAAKDAGTLQESALKPVRFEKLEALIEANYKLKNNRSVDRLQDAMQALKETFGGCLASGITDEKLTEYFNT